jgi:hypothetical protein
MANKRPPWKIPAVIDPPLRRCIQIMIPDDPQHISIFWGQLRALSDWQRWESEPTKSGTLVAQVWRKVVYAIDWSNMSCCPEPTNERFNADGTKEVSYDNGATWVTDHSLDDRYSGTIAPPLEGADGSEKRCVAATSAQEYIKSNLIDSLTEGMTYAEINSTIIAIIALLGVTGVGMLIAAAAAAIFLLGVAATQAAFTTGVWSDLKCILYCAMEDDGSFTEAGWEQVKSKILATYTGVVSAILYNWTNSVGLVGLTNAARSHFAASGDCSGCVCEDCSNLDAWGIVYGTTITKTPGYWKLSSTAAGPNQAVRLARTGAPPSNCCAVVYNVTAGVVQNQAWYRCSDDVVVFSPPVSGDCMYDVGLTNIFNVPFEVEFFFEECP